MNARRIRAGGTLMLACLFLAGCGFHLQGRSEYIPELETVYLDVPNRSTALARELTRSLQVFECEVRLALGDF